jgi:DNA polymerase III subunit delta'
MQFKDVIGQQELKDHLIAVARSGKVAHALLLLGNEGTGGLPLALAFAQYLVCENPGEHDSCGTCPPCIKSGKMQHPDIHYTYPVIKKDGMKTVYSADYAREWMEAVGVNPYITEFNWLQSIKAGNKLGNITAEECRHVIKTLNLMPYEAPYKILVLWKPESLGLSGNILLKLIEEPPPHTVLILVAENREEIIATILSRTQILHVPPLLDEELQAALETRHQLAPDEARHTAFLSGGSYSRALATEGTKGYAKRWLEWLVCIMKPQPAELLKWIDSMAAEGRDPQIQFLEYCMHFMRETTIALYATGSTPRILPEEQPVMRSLIKYIKNLEQIERLSELFEQKAYHIERNASAKITFMDLSLRIQKVLKGLPEPVEVPAEM